MVYRRESRIDISRQLYTGDARPEHQETGALPTLILNACRPEHAKPLAPSLNHGLVGSPMSRTTEYTSDADRASQDFTPSFQMY